MTREQESNATFPRYDFFKIRDSRTTQLEYLDRKNINQGIWIDIFPLDPVPPFKDNQQAINFEVAREMLLAIHRLDIIKAALQNNQQLLMSKQDMENFMKLPFRYKIANYNNFTDKNFSDSTKVGRILSYLFPTDKKLAFDTKDFDETVYLPFEEFKLPAPAGYENCLTAQYGDWRKPVFTHTHSRDWSVDIPYHEYYKTSVFMRR